MEIKIRREYNYSDVYMVPKKCIVNSRSECDTSAKLGKFTFKTPFCAANMKSVVDEETCKFFAKNNWLYIMHRFGIDPVDFTIKMHDLGYISSISIGVKEDSIKNIKRMKESNIIPDIICLDVAYVWSPYGEKMIKLIKDTFPDVFLIAGNVASAEGLLEIETWGADCTKVFVGPGSTCETRTFTGNTRGTVTCGMECSEVATKPIMCDGGVKTVGDLMKALVVSKSGWCMAGNLFAGFSESAGQITEINGQHYKIMYGSSTELSKGENKHIEGKKILVEFKGPMQPFLDHVEQSLQSSISYQGGRDISCFSYSQLFSIN